MGNPFLPEEMRIPLGRRRRRRLQSHSTQKQKIQRIEMDIILVKTINVFFNALVESIR